MNHVTVTNRYVLVFVYMCICMLAVSAPAQTANNRALELIGSAIEIAGGKQEWLDKGNLVVHETQIRYTDGAPEYVSLVHYMDTAGKAYRLEMVRSDGDYIFGWDGHRFWAMKDGRGGDHELEREARRVISDAYYRFSLPFILDDDMEHLEYVGTDRLDGAETQVLKMTYAKGPADRYFETHSGEGTHNTSESQASHGSGADNHHGNEVYYFHFDEQKRLVKVYFSHHGDGNYETLLMSGITDVDGILRETTRKLIRHDGSTLYDAEFTHIDFRSDLKDGFYNEP